MDHATPVLSYTDQPNGSTVVFQPTPEGGTFALCPRGWIFGKHSVSRWFWAVLPRYLIMTLPPVLLCVLAMHWSSASFPWIFLIGVVIAPPFWFWHDWVGRNAHAKLEIFSDRIVLTNFNVMYRRRRSRTIRRDEVAHLRVSLNRLRFCSASERTVLTTDRCGRGDMVWMAAKIRHVLGLPDERSTRWQLFRDFCSLHG